MLDTLVRQLSRELEMEDLLLSPEPNHYTLPFEEDVQVNLFQLPHSYLFKGVVGPSPKDNVETFLLKAMEANLFGRGTRGATLGLKGQEGNVLTLSLELDYNSSYKEFREKLEDFVSVLIFWREEALKHN